MKDKLIEERLEIIGKDIVNAAFTIHKSLGPGLLEKVYEVCLTHELRKIGYDVKRQVYIPVNYDGLEFDEGLRIDMLVEDSVIIELKAQELVHEVWTAQIISHLKMTNLQLGYLINFRTTLIKNGIRRFINT
jgi:GxxExxY protein